MARCCTWKDHIQDKIAHTTKLLQARCYINSLRELAAIHLHRTFGEQSMHIIRDNAGRKKLAVHKNSFQLNLDELGKLLLQCSHTMSTAQQPPHTAV